MFTGAEVEGDSGFVNLMRMKRAWFRSLRPKLMAEIDKRAEKDTSFREELFDKLYTFFHRYFCESGSIYFRHLPAFSKTYERVYADGQDVALSWKTQMLYYVKSDVLVRSMPVELNEEGKPQNTRRFYFDASEFEHKKNNERKDFVFAFNEVNREKEGLVIRINVSYSSGGVKTKIDEILKQCRKEKISLSEDELQKAIGVFRRQTEADFFINKDARGFLREQFDLWVYQYIFQEETVFEEKRIKQLQAIKETAYNIIDFIAQFEDELRRVWEKPKFVRGVNYVVTLDKLTDGILQKITKHKGAKAQIKEWRELGMVDDKFGMKDIFNGQKNMDDKNGAGGKHQFLPLDTKHFKDLELKILGGLGNLDEVLDGELVHSENWQALNTLQSRYKEKVKCIYIDPPFNTGDDFDYKDKFQTSTWLSLMSDRLAFIRCFMSRQGAFYMHLDENANYLGKHLLENVDLDEIQEIIFNTNATKDSDADLFGYKSFGKRFVLKHSTIFYGFNSGVHFAKLWKPNRRETSLDIGWLDLISAPKVSSPKRLADYDFFTERYAKDGKLERCLVDVGDEKIYPIGDLWDDIYSFTQSEMRVSENYSFQTQKPENLMRRIIQSSTHTDDIVMDYFLGSGTSIAVAHKLKRKWVGVEMGNYFGEFYLDSPTSRKIGVLGRMKLTLAGDKNFELLGNPRRSHLSKDINWNGGGAFKYYALEQYEESLKNARYEDGEQLELDSAKSPFEQYVFFGDDKLAHAVQPSKTGKLKINLHNLYPDIDIAESLSNTLGKQIRHRTADAVTFADGTTEKINPTKMNEKEKRHFVSLIKPYLWWG